MTTTHHPFTIAPPSPSVARRPRWHLVDAQAAQRGLDVELLLSTHLSVVVRARLESLDGEAVQETSLVIARLACVGDRPTGAALLAAARQFIGRQRFCAGPQPGPPCRLCVCIAGRWQCLIEGQSSMVRPRSVASSRKELQ